MITYNCDRCGKEIKKRRQDVRCACDLDNYVPVNKDLDPTEEVVNVCYDITINRFDGDDKWIDNDYIHLCKSCQKELMSFLDAYKGVADGHDNVD